MILFISSSIEIKQIFGKSWKKVEDEAGKVLERYIKQSFPKVEKVEKPRQFLH